MRWCLKALRLPETWEPGMTLVEAPVSTSMGMIKSSPVSDSRRAGLDPRLKAGS